MIEHWQSATRVGSLTLNCREEHYERLQPQGGRRIGACGEDHQRCYCASGKRDSRVHQISERRGRACGANSLDQSPAHSFTEIGGVRRLYGAATAQIVGSSEIPQRLKPVVIRRWLSQRCAAQKRAMAECATVKWD